MQDEIDKKSDEKPPPPPDATIRRRRLLLYGFSLVALIAIAVLAYLTFFSSDDETAKQPQRMSPPLIVERFKLTAAAGEEGRGLGELVRRETGDGFRVLAIDLKPSGKEQFYQLLLSAGEKTRVLGNQVIGDEGTFVGEAELSGSELREFRRIELRRVTEGTPPQSDLVLRGRIPR